MLYFFDIAFKVYPMSNMTLWRNDCLTTNWYLLSQWCYWYNLLIYKETCKDQGLQPWCSEEVVNTTFVVWLRIFMHSGSITVPYTNMRQAGFESGSMSDFKLEFETDALNRSATIACYWGACQQASKYRLQIQSTFNNIS